MFKKNSHLLITGGTGSFGKAMIKKGLKLKNIGKISVLSRDEKKQEDIRNEFKSNKLNFILCDIRVRENVISSINDVDDIFLKYQVLHLLFVIFHQHMLCATYLVLVIY